MSDQTVAGPASRLAVGLAALALVTFGGVATASAQGRSGSVSVDTSVLDSLGMPPTVPGLLRPTQPAGSAMGAPSAPADIVVLAPPRTKRGSPARALPPPETAAAPDDTGPVVLVPPRSKSRKTAAARETTEESGTATGETPAQSRLTTQPSRNAKAAPEPIPTPPAPAAVETPSVPPAGKASTGSKGGRAKAPSGVPPMPTDILPPSAAAAATAPSKPTPPEPPERAAKASKSAAAAPTAESATKPEPPPPAAPATSAAPPPPPPPPPPAAVSPPPPAPTVTAAASPQSPPPPSVAAAPPSPAPPATASNPPPAAPQTSAQAAPSNTPALTSAPAQIAARPPAKAADGQQTRLLFSGEATELSEAAKQSLNGVIGKMQADEELRVQLVAYASGPADQAAKARRISLSRALAARAYVLEKGVRSTRIDVRALGNASDEPPADRVDAILTK